MLSSEDAQSIKSYGHFSDLGVKLSVTAMLNFSCQANTSIHGLGEDNTPSLIKPKACLGKESSLTGAPGAQVDSGMHFWSDDLR